MGLTKPDRSKIDIHDGRQARAFARRLGVSREELARLIETVGNSAAEVRKELERTTAAASK
jgi:hypothetical protein